MTDLTQPGSYGMLTEPATLKIERLLPGPIERVWDYLTRSDLRRRWLASGEMELLVGGAFEFVWRNTELSDPPGALPEGIPAERRMTGTITELAPPYRLGISWGSTGGVVFDLAPVGAEVLLTLIHRRVTERSTLLNVSAGWHAHLDVLVRHMNGLESPLLWETWTRLKAEYEGRLAG